MSTIDHGMDVAEIEKLGRTLQDRYAADVRRFIGDIEKLVNTTSTSWVGKDSADFRSWWPAKRSKLMGIADDLHGYGQSALNNASDQRQASEGTAGSSGSESAPGVSTEGPGIASGTPATGALPGSNRTAAEVQQAYESKYSTYGLNAAGGPGGENAYQCVSWAWFRMHELGYEGPTHSGNGWAVAGTLGGTTDTVPALGAVMSYNLRGDEFGHVVIAEEISQNADGSLRVRVSEMNTGSDPYVGRPDEYKSSRELIRNSDGTWLVYGSKTAVTVANPAYKLD